MRDYLSLDDTIGVVTGAASGIGWAIANRLIEMKVKVLMLDIKRPPTIDVKSLDRAGTHPPEWYEFDVTQSEHHDTVAEVMRRLDMPLSVWVNNAGIYPKCDLLEMTEKEMMRIMSTNTLGAFLGIQTAARAMIQRQHRGTIINITSSAAERARMAGYAHYVASKHALLGLTRSASLELAPFGIRVCAVAPGTTYTETFVEVVAGDLDASRQPSVTEDQVARVVCLLATPAFSGVSGSTVNVDSGALAI